MGAQLNLLVKFHRVLVFLKKTWQTRISSVRILVHIIKLKYWHNLDSNLDNKIRLFTETLFRENVQSRDKICCRSSVKHFSLEYHDQIFSRQKWNIKFVYKYYDLLQSWANLNLASRSLGVVPSWGGEMFNSVQWFCMGILVFFCLTINSHTLQ